MKKFLTLSLIILFPLSIYLLFFKPAYSLLTFFIFWLFSFILLLTGNSLKNFYPLFSLFFFLISFLWSKNLISSLVAGFLFLILNFIREKRLVNLENRELKLHTFHLSLFDFKNLLKAIFFVYLFTLILVSSFNQGYFHLIFNSIFDFIDKLAATFQIGFSSKMTLIDFLKSEINKLNLNLPLEDEFYQFTIETLNQRFHLNLKGESTLRALILESLSQDIFVKIILSIIAGLIAFSLFSFLISLLSLPISLLTKGLISFLIKLKLIERTTTKVEKESLRLKNGKLL
jgi:hypothetical protein